MSVPRVQFNRPVSGVLVVKLDNSEEWEATPEDLFKFGYARQLDLYTRAAQMLAEGVGLSHYDELTSHSGPNLIRYIIECAIMYDHSPWADADGKPWSRDEDDDEDDYKQQLQELFKPRLKELCHGVIDTAGGGVVDIIVDYSTDHYPPEGLRVAVCSLEDQPKEG